MTIALRTRNDRSKVGKGNRKIVREHFLKNGIVLPYGRNCVNNRYSFKMEPVYTKPNHTKAINYARIVAESCPVPVEVVPTNLPAMGYFRALGRQLNVALRFEDK